MNRSRERGLVLRYPIPLLICGDPNRTAQTDVRLLQRTSTVLLVVQERFSTKNQEPQVIAEAIAVFQMNDHSRATNGLEKKETMSIPCITRRILYVVPVTQQLGTAVE